LWKRTRLVVFILYACFHTLNHFVFDIGIFPWFTLLGTLLFFDPDWPRQIARKLRSIAGIQTKGNKQAPAAGINQTTIPLFKQRLVFGLCAFWVATQTLIPLRHYLYPGNVSWTEEGHRFSWQMKLRSKESGAVFYLVNVDNRQEFWEVDPEDYLTKKQARTMAGRPDMILQFAHYLSQYWKEHYQKDNLQILATVFVSLNGRFPAMLIDPGRDLLKIERSIKHADWILPLNEPLQRIARQ